MAIQQPTNKREPIAQQRTLFRGLGKGKGALEAILAERHGSVAGVDEVGRGCLAGPVVAAAVILPANHGLRGITDSKLLTPEKREELDAKIRAKAIAVGVGLVEADEIDRINILNASLKAMRIAVEGLQAAPGSLLIDGIFKIPGMALPQQVVVKGDLKCRCIGAASIVAKVFRDRLMAALDATHPGYGFAEHKGYGCPSHRRALQAKGPTPIHRKSFFGVLPAGADEDQESLDFDAANREHLAVGDAGEGRAAALYLGEGWREVARNWRCKVGEIDLIVARGETLALVEVKTRDEARPGTFQPLDNMTPGKIRKLVRAAKAWLQSHPKEAKGLYPRFDVVTVVGRGASARVERLENAFEAPE